MIRGFNNVYNKCFFKNIWFKSQIIKLKKFKAEESIFIISEPRSGSTWLMELFMNDSSIIPIWEPFHKDKGIWPEMLIPDYRLNKEMFENKSFNQFIIKLAKGYIGNQWTYSYLRKKIEFDGKRILIKSVRAINVLPELAKILNFKYKILVLLRHPVPTALSNLKNFRKGFEENDILEFIERWCLRYEHALLNEEKYYLIYYEDLILNPKSVFGNIIDYYNLNINKDLDYLQGSKSDFKNDFERDADIQLRKWMNELKPDFLLKVQESLSKNKIKCYNVESPYALKS